MKKKLRKKTEKAIRAIIEAKIRYSFEDNLDKKIDEAIYALKNRPFDAHDTVTVVYQFKFSGIDFFTR